MEQQKQQNWMNSNARWFIILSALAAAATILTLFITLFNHSSSPSTAISCSGNCGIIQPTTTLQPSAPQSSATFTPTPTFVAVIPTITPNPTSSGNANPPPLPTATPIPTPPPCPDTYHTGEYDKVIDQAPPPTVHPGDRFSLYFTLCNDGTITWSDASGYKFQCDDVYHTQPSNGFIPSCMGGGQYGFGGTSVAPGQIFKFVLELVAPQQVGMYQTWWDMRNGSGGIMPSNNNYINVYVTN